MQDGDSYTEEKAATDIGDKCTVWKVGSEQASGPT